jgi:DNA-binding MarR family transcriptional regulator
MEEKNCCRDLTISQCHPLLEIDELGMTNLVDLASRLELDPSTLCRTIEGLVKRGLVRRESDYRDKRYVVLSLTQKGKAISDEINEVNDHFYENFLSRLPDIKQEDAIKLFRAFVETLSKTADSCDECFKKPD